MIKKKRGKKVRAKRACMACRRVVSVLQATQNNGGGKARVRHLCPHGVVCITGAKPMYGSGFNAAPSWGKHACLKCQKVTREERGFGTSRMVIEE